MNPHDPIELYIARLRKSLPGFSVGEREDIVEEIRAHIVDRVADSGLTVEETLARLGPAEELAKDYQSGALVRRARHSFSPWIILKATFRWAMTGVHGLGVFLVAVCGYLMGTAFIVCGALKPLLPDQIGLWIGRDVFEVGYRPGGVAEAQEVLGPWFTQIAIGLGLLLFILTTMLVRKLFPKLRNWRASATAATTSALNRA